MEKGSVLVFQQTSTTQLDQSGHIVELESHRQLHHTITELIQLSSCITTSEMQQRLQHATAQFGDRFTHQLVRALHRKDQQERQALVWLLTLLDDQVALPVLQQMSQNKRLPRSIRLSASLVLAGMSATPEITDSSRREQTVAGQETPQHARLYAIS
ncbi:MAG: hypothetical protein E6J34_02980 [Chloroflexi bacterium]|nr:MAG: hypothetical protein E6J34_02980 [Chloroflexota bacterium]